MERTSTFNLLGIVSQHFLGPAPTAPALELSGIWHCDDGGRYAIRQIGPDVMWHGQATTPPSFMSVAHGQLDGDGWLRLSWADLPGGERAQCGGLLLRMTGPERMELFRETGGFTGTVWARLHR